MKSFGCKQYNFAMRCTYKPVFVEYGVLPVDRHQFIFLEISEMKAASVMATSLFNSLRLNNPAKLIASSDTRQRL